LKEIFTDSELIKVYIPLITGVLGIILTIFYNQWKERKTDIRLKDAYFRVKTATRKIGNIPLPEKKDNKNTLLICDSFNELEKKENLDTFAQFVILENTSDNGIFNISINHKFSIVNNENITKDYYQDFMMPREIFYLTVAEFSENLGYKSKSMKINYETSAGVKYQILEQGLSGKLRSMRIKVRFIFGFVPIVQLIKFRMKKSLTVSRSLEFNSDK